MRVRFPLDTLKHGENMDDYNLDNKDALKEVIESAAKLVKAIKETNASVPYSVSEALRSLDIDLSNIGVPYNDLNPRGY